MQIIKQSKHCSEMLMISRGGELAGLIIGCKQAIRHNRRIRMSGKNSSNRHRVEIGMTPYSRCIWSPSLLRPSTSSLTPLWSGSRWRILWRAPSSVKSQPSSQSMTRFTSWTTWQIFLGTLGKLQSWMPRSWWLGISPHRFWTATTCTTSSISSWMSVGSSSERTCRTISLATSSTLWEAPSGCKVFSKKSSSTSPSNIMQMFSSSMAGWYRSFSLTSTWQPCLKQTSRIRTSCLILLT